MKLWNCHFRLNQEMIVEVERLVGRAKLGALSNTNALHAEYFRAQLPILKKFDQVLLSHELRMMKPEPAIFLEALRRLDSAAAETVFFDDIPAYVEAARSLGIQAHVFRSAAEFRSELLSLGL
jgi:putative hydrolase of the HAD superfamily